MPYTIRELIFYEPLGNHTVNNWDPIHKISSSAFVGYFQPMVLSFHDYDESIVSFLDTKTRYLLVVRI